MFKYLFIFAFIVVYTCPLSTSAQPEIADEIISRFILDTSHYGQNNDMAYSTIIDGKSVFFESHPSNPLHQIADSYHILNTLHSRLSATTPTTDQLRVLNHIRDNVHDLRISPFYMNASFSHIKGRQTLEFNPALLNDDELSVFWHEGQHALDHLTDDLTKAKFTLRRMSRTLERKKQYGKLYSKLNELNDMIYFRNELRANRTGAPGKDFLAITRNKYQELSDEMALKHDIGYSKVYGAGTKMSADEAMSTLDGRLYKDSLVQKVISLKRKSPSSTAASAVPKRQRAPSPATRISKRKRGGGKLAFAMPLLTWLGLQALEEEEAVAVGTLIGGPNKYEIEVLDKLPQMVEDGAISPWTANLIRHDIYHRGP